MALADVMLLNWLYKNHQTMTKIIIIIIIIVSVTV